MAIHRLHSHFEPVPTLAPHAPAAAKLQFSAAPLGFLGGGLQPWQTNLYAWAKSRAVADVAARARSRRIWSISRN